MYAAPENLSSAPTQQEALVKGIVKGAVIGIAAVMAVGLAFAAVPVWIVVIEPWWNARGLYAAADEARSRPYVTAAEVYLDWLDGDRLVVNLDPSVAGEDAMRLWCEVLLKIESYPDGAGPWVEVYRGQFTEIRAPRDC